MAGCGLLIAALTGLLSSWWYAPLTGWIAASAAYVIVVWSRVGRLGPEETRTHATREDPGRTVSDLLITVASLASLVAVVVLLLRGKADHGLAQVTVAALVFVSVALTWTLIHSLYTLRYAREYYARPEKKLIEFDFPKGEPQEPRYTDFAYLSFDLGMTFQVSDTTLRSSELRALVLRHTLLSYAFGTIVLASTINLVVGLGG